MAYKVDYHLPARMLGAADVEFQIKENGKKLGTLKVSNGSVTWFKINASNGKRIHWRKFAEAMDHAEGVKEKR